MTRWTQHADFIGCLGVANRYSPALRYSDGGAAVPFDRAARRRRNRVARRARAVNA